jgi:uncharacterized protein (DUF58 family)
MSAGPPGRRRRRRSGTRPLSWVAPVTGSLVALGAFAVVARSSGSGWVQTFGIIVAGVLVAGMVAPSVPACRATVECTGSPSDAVAGQPVEVVLTTNAALRVRPRSPQGPEVRATGAPFGRRAVTVTLHPEHRGVVDRMVVEMATSAPFGLLWWGREVVVTLTRPLHVAPRWGAEEPVTTAPLDRAAAGASPVPAALGDPRGVRPYAPGDPRRRVHWPATAHVGALMVRETERAIEDPVVIDVTLPSDAAAAEATCERARGTGCAWLARGRVVILSTDEEGRRVTAPVRDPVELGRRLARARPPSGGSAPGHGRWSQ